MAYSENDVTEGSTETRISRNNRAKLLGEGAIDLNELAAAMVGAQDRASKVRDTRVLGEVVRCSCRVGLDRAANPKSYTFKANETAEGRELTVQHGKPLRLKREAFQRYAADGVVVISE